MNGMKLGTMFGKGDKCHCGGEITAKAYYTSGDYRFGLIFTCGSCHQKSTDKFLYQRKEEKC